LLPRVRRLRAGEDADPTSESDHPRSRMSRAASSTPRPSTRRPVEATRTRSVDAFGSSTTCAVSTRSTGLEKPGTQTELPNGPTRRGKPSPPSSDRKAPRALLSGSPSKAPPESSRSR
jgi:hypothetical protein